MKRAPPILPPWPFDPFARAQCWEVCVIHEAARTFTTEYFTMKFPRDVAGHQALAEAKRHWRTFILRAAP